MNTLANGEIQCMEICGDGIVINDPCDDGNTLNGDGCSEFCKIEKDWSCLNKTKCDVKAKPEIKVLRSVKVARMNRIEIYLDLTVGLRLVRENFVLTFSDSG
jgi:cysteine-rich repeat protein